MDGDVGGVGYGLEAEWCGEGGGGQKSGYENAVHGYDGMMASIWV